MGERKVGREIRVEAREPQGGRSRDRGETKIQRETSVAEREEEDRDGREKRWRERQEWEREK